MFMRRMVGVVCISTLMTIVTRAHEALNNRTINSVNFRTLIVSFSLGSFLSGCNAILEIRNLCSTALIHKICSHFMAYGSINYGISYVRISKSSREYGAYIMYDHYKDVQRAIRKADGMVFDGLQIQCRQIECLSGPSRYCPPKSQQSFSKQTHYPPNRPHPVRLNMNLEEKPSAPLPLEAGIPIEEQPGQEISAETNEMSSTPVGISNEPLVHEHCHEHDDEHDDEPEKYPSLQEIVRELNVQYGTYHSKRHNPYAYLPGNHVRQAHHQQQQRHPRQQYQHSYNHPPRYQQQQRYPQQQQQQHSKQFKPRRMYYHESWYTSIFTESKQAGGHADQPPATLPPAEVLSSAQPTEPQLTAVQLTEDRVAEAVSEQFVTDIVTETVTDTAMDGQSTEESTDEPPLAPIPLPMSIASTPIPQTQTQTQTQTPIPAKAKAKTINKRSVKKPSLGLCEYDNSKQLPENECGLLVENLYHGYNVYLMKNIFKRYGIISEMYFIDSLTR